jgi:hypothetical protein
MTARSVAGAVARTASAEARRRRDLMDVAGGAAIYAGTFLLFVGVPAGAGAFGLLFLTSAIGAAAGALSAWQRGGLSLVIWGGAALVDWLLLIGPGGLFRFFATTILGSAIGLTRRMDRMEGM